MKTTNQHIILIGFMGTGKTTVGIKLANKLKRNHVDTDKVIEIMERLSISDIFSIKGEEYFRELEVDLFSSLINSDTPLVISTGGGIVLSEKNRIAMLDSIIILLKATPKVIYKRIHGEKGRPLLDKEQDLLTHIEELLEQREELYKQASNYTIETDEKGIDQIVNEILEEVII